ncbi:MAG: hypothetical protein NTW41_05310 [Verrucomicrobia bacterium]|nr:hypothetical protein [Verrucomicrobiota bacterium]
MLPEITLRLAICANACPIGPRLERGTPMPAYQHTYALEERDQAEADMRRVREYVERNQNTMKGRK